MLRSYFLQSSHELIHSIQGVQGKTLNMYINPVGLEPVVIYTTPVSWSFWFSNKIECDHFAFQLATLQ